MLIYVDTSVFGGVLDAEFQALSTEFFNRVRTGAIDLVVSQLVLDELEEAPTPVRYFFEELTPHIERVSIDEDAYMLREAYIEAGVLTRRWEVDALHVAIATVCGCRQS